ncbi:MAG: hypothetical protein ACP5O5_07370 [Fervidicoccaceae archaeon]
MLLVDAYVRPKNEEEINKIFELEARFGYKAVGIDKQYEGSSDERIVTFPVRVVSGRNEAEAKEVLRECKKGELVISKPNDPGSLRVFSRDTRAHIVEISPKLVHLMDRNQAELLKVGKSFIGFSLSSLIDDPKMFWWLSFLLNYSMKYNIDLVIFSGASRFEELVHPKTTLNLLIQAGSPKEIAFKIMDGNKLLKILGIMDFAVEKR